MSPCSVDGCPNAAQKGGLCYGHRKRKQRGQTVSVALAVRPKSPVDRLTEAALTYAEADNDEEWRRARDNLLKSAAAARAAAISELTRAAIGRLKAAGVPLGPPRKVRPEQAERAVAEARSVSEAARKLGVAVSTMWRVLAKARR